MEKLRIQVIETPDTITTFWLGGGTRRGVVECHRSDGPLWWLSRALVHPPEERGKGVGRNLLRAILARLRDRQEPIRLIVEPGGYEGNTARQSRFYLNNGFVQGDGYLFWENPIISKTP